MFAFILQQLITSEALQIRGDEETEMSYINCSKLVLHWWGSYWVPCIAHGIEMTVSLSVTTH